MITLALFNQMAADGVANLTKNKDFFWEELPLQANGKPATGVWLVTRGGTTSPTARPLNMHTTVDFYVAFPNKAQTEVVHGQILDYFNTTKGFCELSGSVSGTDYEYDFTNVRIHPTTTPQNDGVTENGVIVKVASVELVYDKQQL